ncbi:MAG: sigma 54-interacting transcriptional regulator [Planctomycetota bacterium]|jgi:DNA-binding NtrC family response regulator
MSLRRIVAISKDAELQQSTRRVAREIFAADDLAEAPQIIETVDPDLIVLDHCFSLVHIRQFFNWTDNNSINIPVVVVDNDESDVDLSSQFKQMGAYDYLRARPQLHQLEQIADRIKSDQQMGAKQKDSSVFFADEFAASVSMVGRSRAFRKTLAMIRLVAASRCNPVLIVGETGTGKELAAQAIHRLRHPDEPFVAVNCATLTANLLESELFGHEKGSFTGADREKTGLLELAGCGTILLDEISEMPLELQTKLLRVLQEKTFRKVGGVKNITCNATIIATSNRNLYKEAKASRFRRDLYYRLNICPVIIAPLKSPDRKDDISLLAEYFLKTSTICPEKISRITCLTQLAIEALGKHDWPGNVRELQNVVERAIMLETTDKIGLDSIAITCEYADPTDNPVQGRTEQIKDFSLAKAERELITRALQETHWQKTRAAALLGITRATLYAKVRQYNIQRTICSAGGRQTAEQNAAPTSPSTQPVATP